MEDFVSAASRHWDTAVFLARHERWQEAAYLAGYVAECSWKGLLALTAPDVALKRLGHDLGALSGEALDMAMLLSPATRRHGLPRGGARGTCLASWTPDMRYAKTEGTGLAGFRRTVEDGVGVGERVLLGMVLDGVIKELPHELV